MNGVVIAGTASKVGKTVATLVVLQALKAAGYTPQPAKAGPDYLDPSHHAVVCEQPSRTLDPWLSGEDGCLRNYWQGTGDLCVVEGMMGLYDGTHSTAAVAETLDIPVIVVVNGKASMESVAAEALGFRDYASNAGRDIDVVGIIAQHVDSDEHAAGIRDALPDGLAYYGRIPTRPGLDISSRHLGLYSGDEAPIDTGALDEAAKHINITPLVTEARSPPKPSQNAHPTPLRHDRSDTTVAIAEDDAFCFLYPATREVLCEQANVVTFSPVGGDPVPPCDGVYFPGGYPERFAQDLESGGTLETIADRAADGLPIIGECGGLMALGESLTTVDCDTYSMAGILPVETMMRDQYQALDHVQLRACEPSVIADVGDMVHGHEFHYSQPHLASDATCVFDVTRGDGLGDGHDGLIEYQTVGTYTHFHADSGIFNAFIKSL